MIIKKRTVKTLRFPEKFNDLPQITRKPQTSGDGSQVPDSQYRYLLPHSSFLLVFPSSDLHYQEVNKNILFKELPYICIFKGGSALPPDGPNLDINRRPQKEKVRKF